VGSVYFGFARIILPPWCVFHSVGALMGSKCDANVKSQIAYDTTMLKKLVNARPKTILLHSTQNTHWNRFLARILGSTLLEAIE
jgi:hypothetical protein